jgi:hypothetical protein
MIAVTKDKFRRELARIFLPVTAMRLKFLLVAHAENSLLDYDFILVVDMCLFEDVNLYIYPRD